jgi:hypothetical protein
LRTRHLRDLEPDGDSAAREAEHHDIVAAGVLAQPLREQPARFGSVPELHCAHCQLS